MGCSWCTFLFIGKELNQGQELQCTEEMNKPPSYSLVIGHWPKAGRYEPPKAQMQCP